MTGICMRIVVASALIGAVAGVAAAQTPSPALLVVFDDARAGEMLGIIDPASGRVVGRVPVGRDANRVAVSEDGRFAFVANTNGHGRTVPDGDSISVIDLIARKEVRRVPVGNGSRPYDVRVAGGKVYFTAESSRMIGRYDPAANRIEYFGLGQNGPHMIAISRDMNTMYAANARSNNVSIIEGLRAGPAPPGGSLTLFSWNVTVVPVGKWPEGIDISPDGREVWTANQMSDGISIIDVATKLARTFDLKTQHGNRLKFTPDGMRVLLRDADTGEILIIDARTRTVVTRVKLPGDTPGETVRVSDFEIVPDGSRAYVSVGSNARGGRHYIGVLDLKTLEVTRRIQTDSAPGSIAWVGSK